MTNQLEMPRQSEENASKRHLSPLVITIMGGIGTAFLAITNNWFQWHQTQDVEGLKLRAALIQKALEPATPEARKDYLLFLVKAGLIADPGDKIKNLAPSEIPHEFGFVPSPSLTPELVSTLDKKLQDFQKYLRTVGLQADTKPSVNIQAQERMRRKDMICYYDDNTPGAPELVIRADYANDPDFVFREYSHHVLSTNRPSGAPKYDRQDARYRSHYAIESALAYYLPCSFRNSPKFGEVEARTEIPVIDLSQPHKLNELKGDAYSMYYGDAEIWGSLFWQLRSKCGRERIDGLLAKAWANLDENASPANCNVAFARSIEEAVSKQLGKADAANVKAVFASYGLQF
jgi:hypothetical protein